MNLWFGRALQNRIPVFALMIAIAAMVLVVPSFYPVHAIQCNNDRGFWNPEPGASYSQTATACNSGYMAVSSSATVTTLVPQSGSYTFTACKVPAGQLAFCTISNTVFTRTVNTGQGVFPNDSTTYNAKGANTWYTSLDVTVLDTTTGQTNDISNLACASNVGPCPV